MHAARGLCPLSEGPVWGEERWRGGSQGKTTGGWKGFVSKERGSQLPLKTQGKWEGGSGKSKGGRRPGEPRRCLGRPQIPGLTPCSPGSEYSMHPAQSRVDPSSVRAMQSGWHSGPAVGSLAHQGGRVEAQQRYELPFKSRQTYTF